MVFYVYMSPDVICDANSGGRYAMEALINILLGFVQNCFIADFKDKRMQNKVIYSHVNEMPDSAQKKKIMTLLGELKKRNHFICSFIPDNAIENINISSVNDQADDALLDFLLVGENEISQIGWNVEAGSLSNYAQSDFASKRSSLACNGRVLKHNELDQDKFLDEVFKKAFIYTTKIEICDRIFGKFSGNFEYTFSTLFTWLKKNLIEPDGFERIIINCQKYEDNYEDMKKKLALFKSEKWSNVEIEIRFYFREKSGRNDPPPALPHDRFIITDQMAFTIGKGMDFLNQHTKRNRDTSINYSKPEEIRDTISKYSQWMLEPVVI